MFLLGLIHLINRTCKRRLKVGKEIESKLIETCKLERLPRDRDANQKIQKAIESKVQERSIHTRSLVYNSRSGLER